MAFTILAIGWLRCCRASLRLVGRGRLWWVLVDVRGGLVEVGFVADVAVPGFAVPEGVFLSPMRRLALPGVCPVALEIWVAVYFFQVDTIIETGPSLRG